MGSLYQTNKSNMKLFIALTLATVALSAPANLRQQANQVQNKVAKKIQTLAQKHNINIQEVEDQADQYAQALANFLQNKYPQYVNNAKAAAANAQKEAQQLVKQNKNQSAKKHFQNGVQFAKQQCNSIPEQFAYLKAPCLKALQSNVNLNLTYKQHVDQAAAEAAALAKQNQQ